MRIPEYLCYYIIYVYPENIFPIFTGCKDNAFAYIAKTCEGVVLFCRKTMNYIPLS